MTRYAVSVAVVITDGLPDEEDLSWDQREERRAGLEARIDRAMSLLIDVGDVIDPSIDAEFSTMSVRVTMSVDADEPLQGMEKACQVVREALRADGDTGWAGSARSLIAELCP